MYFGTVSYVAVVLCLDFIAASDVANSTAIKNSTLAEANLPLGDGLKESNQRRRDMESEMAYPQGYFPPFMGDFQPSTPSYRRVAVRRESVPIVIERTVSSQPAIITRDPLQKAYITNVYNPGTGYFQNVPSTYQPVYKTQGTYDASYARPLFQQQEYVYQDPNRSYQPQIYQTPQITQQYPTMPNYNYQPQTNQYGRNIGYSMYQPLDNTQLMERELQTLRELEEQHRRLLQQINARAQGALYYNSDSSLTRKVITQYPTDQDAPQYTTPVSYPTSSQSTILIMDPSTQGVISRDPYGSNQIRISRHPGQIPAPEFVHKNKRNDAAKRKAEMTVMGEAKMAVPVMIKLKVSSGNPGNIWKYFELKSTEHVRSVYQPDPHKTFVPYPDLLPPCPGGFLCDDIPKPARPSPGKAHAEKTPEKDQPQTTVDHQSQLPKGEDENEPNQATGDLAPSDNPPKDSEQQMPETQDSSTTDTPAIVMPDDPKIPEKDDTDNFIFLGSEEPEDSAAKDSGSTDDLDPRSSTSLSSEDKSVGIEYKLGE